MRTEPLATNLARYDHKRMVVMRPEASVYDAVRALEANHIGCILVAEPGRLLGVVTDRDLALRVIAYELDSRDFCLKDVMTPDVATVRPNQTEADAAELMLARRVRRIPIEEDGRVVGIVTLDDLVIHGFDPAVIARIIVAQLAEPASLKEKGDVHPMAPTHESPAELTAKERAERRHHAHADASYGALLRRVMDETGLETRETAEAALEALLTGILERVTSEEAANVLAQLPAHLRARLSGVSYGPNRRVTRETVEGALSLRLGVGDARAAQLVSRLGRALAGAISRGELHDVKAQLPADLRTIFP